MTRKSKKTQGRKPRARRVGSLQASADDGFVSPPEDFEALIKARWHRPRKKRICLRLDMEVVDWFRSQGRGYQTRMNGILRKAMMAGKKKKGE
ncbi:MAG TPA: BrnA antitoxin family protein [Terriglobales bacterium]|nr:BrnA antitoxin family protein [Terriglobales bacterium]